MSIDSAITFLPGAYRSIVRLLCTLPEELKITHHSEGERAKRRPLPDDIEEYLDAKPGPKQGFFLRGGTGGGRGQSNTVCFFSGCSGNMPDACHVSFKKITPALAEVFLLHMAKAELIFAFICSSDEYKQRNYLKVEWEVTPTNASSGNEVFIGRDSLKYIPGFYWMTLLPDALAKKHGVPIAKVKKVAQEHRVLSGGQHLFRFYEKPEDWKSTSKVAELCAALPGAFDIEPIRAKALLTKNEDELEPIYAPW